MWNMDVFLFEDKKETFTPNRIWVTCVAVHKGFLSQLRSKISQNAVLTDRDLRH